MGTRKFAKYKVEKRTGDVANRPARLLANALFRAAQQGEQARQGVVVDDKLRLQVVARDDVADRAERRRLHGRRRVEQQLDQAPADAGLDDDLDLLVGAVREVAQRPARVREDFLVGRKDELRERRQSRRDHGEIGLRLAAAKVGQRPRGVAEHGELGILVQLVEQRVHRPGLQDEVAAGRGIAGDVPQRPHGLLAHVVVGAHEESHEDRDGAHFHDDLGVLRRARRDVGQAPRRLELQRGVVVALEEFDEARDDAGVNDGLDRRVLFDAEQSPELRGALHLHGGVVAHDARDHAGQLLELRRGEGVVGVRPGRGVVVVAAARAAAVHHAGVRRVARVQEHAGGGQTRRRGGGQPPRGHLAALGEAGILLRLANLEGGFVARAAALFRVERLFKAAAGSLRNLKRARAHAWVGRARGVKRRMRHSDGGETEEEHCQSGTLVLPTHFYVESSLEFAPCRSPTRKQSINAQRTAPKHAHTRSVMARTHTFNLGTYIVWFHGRAHGSISRRCGAPRCVFIFLFLLSQCDTTCRIGDPFATMTMTPETLPQ